MSLMAIPAHIEDLDNFLSQCHRKSYPNRSTIIYEGDKCDILYYIIKGSVSAVLEDDDGKEVIIAYLNPGDFFGEMGCSSDRKKEAPGAEPDLPVKLRKSAMPISMAISVLILKSFSLSVNRWPIDCAIPREKLAISLSTTSPVALRAH